MYWTGQGVPQDYQEALEWYRKSAALGNAEAQSNLGSMYANGEGVPQDDIEAVKWLLKAAEQGMTHAQYLLGLRFAEGRGVTRDNVKAYVWFSLVIARPPTGEIDDRSAAEWQQIVAASSMTPAQIAEAERLVRERKPVPSQAE
jgi:hypothetical protein